MYVCTYMFYYGHLFSCLVHFSLAEGNGKERKERKEEEKNENKPKQQKKKNDDFNGSTKTNNFYLVSCDAPQLL